MAQLTCPQCGTTFEAQGAEFCPNPSCGYPVAFMKPPQEDDTQALHMERRPGEQAEEPAPVAVASPPDHAPTEVIPRVVVPPPIAPPAYHPPSPPRPPRNLTPWLVGAGALVLVAGLVVAIVALSGGGTPGDGGTGSPTATTSGGHTVSVQALDPSHIAADAESTHPDVTLKNGTLLTYRLSNTLDGDLKTAWNDGDENGYALGTHLSYTFDQPVHVVAVVLVNGYAQSFSNEDVFHENGRLKTVTFDSDDDSFSTTLQDTVDAQRIDRDFGTTSKIVIRLDDVYEGNKYTDSALTEITFMVEA